jgi:DNA-binding CsgD family transcriptional regulator/tetratricopeptide (TPR) repeat protein
VVPEGGIQLNLVGRAAELQELTVSLQAVAEGFGRTVVIEGEPGIGKSSLLREIIEGAQGLGINVFSAAGEELERRRPFGVVSDCLGLLRTTDGRRSGIARILLDETASLTTTGRDPLSGSPTTEFRVVEACLALVEDLATQGPLLLALDDLHWADRSSLVVINRLARCVDRLPVLLVCTCRQLPRSSELDLVISELTRLGARHLVLQPLEGTAVADLVMSLTGRHPGPRLLQQVAGAGGNPLFVCELVEALVTNGSLTVLAGETLDIDAVAVPTASLSLTILHRLSFLATDTLDLLRVAAILGTSFRAHDLSAVTGVQPLSLIAGLREALASGVLVEDPSYLRFRHELVRQALLEDLPQAVRRTLHRDVARHLTDSGAPARLVAEHLVRGAEPGDEEALSYLRSTAAELASTAPATAAELLDKALLLAGRSHPNRDQMLAERAVSLMWAGDVAGAARLCEETLARQFDPSVEGIFRVCLSRALLAGGRGADALRQADLAALDPTLSAVERARLLAWSSTIQISLGEVDQAAAVAEQAVAAAEACDDLLAQCIALTTIATASNFLGRLTRGVEVVESAVRVADRSRGLEAHRFHVNFYRAILLMEVDRLEESLEAIRIGRRLSEDLGVKGSLPLYQWAAALSHYLSGRWDDAIAESEACLELAADLGTRQGILLVHALRSLVALHRNDLDTAESAARAAEQELEVTGQQHGLEHWVSLARALLLEANGSPDAACGLLWRAWEVCVDARLITYYPDLGPDLARLAMATNKPACAADVCEALESMAASNCEVPRLAAEAAYCRGLLDGDPERLVRAASHRRSGARPLDLARTCEQAASMLVRVGRGSAADPLFDETIVLYERLGASRDVARVEASLRDAGRRRGRRGPRPRARTGWASLTDTERAVADLAGQGLSNPEIAARLFISRHTVHTHMGHILDKIGVKSRVELAASLARRPGPTVTVENS